MHRTKPPRGRRRSRPASPADCLVQSLLQNCNTAAEALELYYWSKEPGLVDIIRALAAMPPETRGVLETFLAFAREPKAVQASLDGRGVLRLSSAEVAKNTALALCGADDGLPRVLN